MAEKLIEELLIYAKKNLDLKGLDIIYLKSLLMAEFKITAPYSKSLSNKEIKAIKNLQVPDKLISQICDLATAKNLCLEGMELSFASKIMALLSPSPENTVKKFNRIKNAKGIKFATQYLYDLSIKNNYIQKTAIDKNIVWRADFEDNFLELTINLSKPEKDNKEIARQLKQASVSYPLCMLCPENLGFEGNFSKPPRQNLRIVPVKLGGEEWFMQYSPYLYYEQHCIAFSKEHKPMKVDISTVQKLIDFVDVFPEYFIGSNASLPIVGGSILSHEHFQGGGHKMPLHYAQDKDFYKGISDVKISTVKWYNSVIRIKSKNKDSIITSAKTIFDKWQDYNDEECKIISKTIDLHNAITPIMRKENGEYVLELILRNNRTNDSYPDGIFHAHAEYHNIKKEGIGLIEAMGLYILPARLKNQTEEIIKILCNERVYEDDLQTHKKMIELLLNKHSNTLNKEQAEKAVNGYINDVCKNILINTAVFKPDEKGQKAFNKFLISMNLQIISEEKI